MRQARVRWCFVLAICVLASTAFAQNDDAAIPTLRVYTNVLQIPTLVLDAKRKPIPRIAENRFLISIDQGKRSRVSHVRIEGDDPIALAVLIDGNSLTSGLRSRLKDAISEMMPDSLHAQDSVSLYGLQCGLSRVTATTPLTPARLREASDVLVQAMNGAAARKPCGRDWNLLDSMISAVEGLETQPGRRVLLVLSNGEDHGSRNKWDSVREYAQLKGVAVFAVADTRGARRDAFSSLATTPLVNLAPLCEATGGILIDDADDGLKSELREFVQLVRGRYIVEFPRPATGKGWHSMDITIDKLAATIHPAGVSVPLPDPSLAKDPKAILPDPSLAPAVGTKPPKL